MFKVICLSAIIFSGCITSTNSSGGIMLGREVYNDGDTVSFTIDTLGNDVTKNVWVYQDDLLVHTCTTYTIIEEIKASE